MSIRTLKLAAWGGFLSLLLLIIGFWVVAGFIPPPSPSQSAQDVAQRFHEDRNAIRSGMILCMFGGTLLMPFSAAFCIHMRRIEGRHSLLAFTQLGLGTLLVFEFLILSFFWQVATFRADSVPESQVQLLNDLAWIPFIAMTSTIVMQAACIGIAILMDGRRSPIFPRWAGYLNLLCASCLTPGTFVVFFKSGPLAWNGILAFYVPVATFAVWMVANCWLLLKAADHRFADEPGRGDRADFGTSEAESLPAVRPPTMEAKTWVEAQEVY